LYLYIYFRRNGKGVRLTVDHKATDPCKFNRRFQVADIIQDEIKRITELGGWVTMGRVACMLAISRSFGDYELKDWVPAKPYTQETKLTEEDTHLILACDGVNINYYYGISI
jgi:protein phosphatase PTC1